MTKISHRIDFPLMSHKPNRTMLEVPLEIKSQKKKNSLNWESAINNEKKNKIT